MFYGFLKQRQIPNHLKPNAKDASELIRWAYQFRTKKEYMERHREDQIFRYNKNRYFTDLQLRDPDYQLKLRSIDEMNKEFDIVVQIYEKSGKVSSFKHVTIDRTLSMVDQTINASQTIIFDNSFEQNSQKNIKSQLKKNKDLTCSHDKTQDLEIFNEIPKNVDIEENKQYNIVSINDQSKQLILQKQSSSLNKNQDTMFQARSINVENRQKAIKEEHMQVQEVRESDEESSNSFRNKNKYVKK